MQCCPSLASQCSSRMTAERDTAWDMDSDDDDVFVGNPSQMGDREPSVPTALAALAGEAPRNEGVRTAIPDRGAAISGENTNKSTTGKKGTTGKCWICQRQRPVDEKVSGFT